MSTFQHGTATAYKNHGCRCEPCTRAGVRYSKAWRVATRTVTGPPVQPMRVPLGPVVEHLRACLDSGWGYRALAREAGIASSQMSKMLRSRQASTHRDVAARIFDIAPLVPVEVDPVVVERLISAFPERIWDDMGATRAERIAAAEQLDARGSALRPHLKGRGFGDQQVLAPGRNEIERCLSLRAGRDFAVRQEVAS